MVNIQSLYPYDPDRTLFTAGNDPSRRCGDTDDCYVLVTNGFSHFDGTAARKGTIVTKGQCADASQNSGKEGRSAGLE
jgi:hypothetical protein